MIIALFPNEKKDPEFAVSRNICQFLCDKGITVLAEDSKAQSIKAQRLSDIDPNQIDFFIAMGGDGTILRIAQTYKNFHVPILGINLGHLGFMTDIPAEDIYPSLQDLLDGKYVIEQRLSLNAQFAHNHLFAINDIVLHRAKNHSLIELCIHVDDMYLNTFVADGIIVATPNGSSAYSLAAGGPIISPKLDAIVITPICAHTISNRPIVLSPDLTIKVEYLSDYDPIDVRADGFEAYSLSSHQSVTISRHHKPFQLVRLHRHEYFSILRSKLNWSGKLK